ncbi:MAG TPA: AI-2E family transporter [Chitinophagaceae bacterium]|nr:AI-2E family transporter [Chitinophagaceae bacterium]
MVKTWPLYAKITILILLIYLVLYGLYIGQDILAPLGFAFLFAVLLRPMEKQFIKWRVPKILAIVFTVVIALLFVAGLITFLSKQIASFVQDIPAIKHNLNSLWTQFQRWISSTFNLTRAEQQKIIQKATSDADPVSTLGVITASVATVILVPVYVFLFLYYRTLLLRFVVELFDGEHHENVNNVIQEIRYVVQRYITGLLTETSIVAALNVTGLLIIGAPYPILLGIISAILNLIPYIGGLVALVLTALITFTNTGSISMAVSTIIVFMIVQLIDNNFLVPRIIASKVKINALISVVGVLIGGALCGISGMFLSIPIIAILKVIFDKIEDLQPWGKLLGDDIPTAGVLKNVFKKRRKAGIETKG